MPNYILHLMRYNHALQEFYLANGYTDDNDRRLLGIFPRGYWAEQDTFERLFEFVYREHLPIDDLNGNKLKEPYYIEESTGFDESWPQHYQFHTALLDWSYNFLVAIYFALGSALVETKKSERMLYTASSLPPSYLSIFAYKEIGGAKTPIKIIPGSTLKTNLRLARQEGTFTYFNETFHFFLLNNQFPSMEVYNSENFKLIRLNIERTSAKIQFLKAFIEERGICESFLFPEKEKLIAESDCIISVE